MKNNAFLSLAAILMVVLACSCKRTNSAKLNLDFELIDSKTGKHPGWYIDNDQNYNIGFDSKVVHAGKYSLKIENIGKYTSDTQVKEVYLIIENAKARKNIKLSGFIKTENTNSDSLGIFIMTSDAALQPFIFSKSKNFIGTHDWQEYSIDVTLNKELERFVIGGCLIGKGKVWIDDLKLFVDGKQIQYNPVTDFVANHKQVKWLRDNCTKIKTVQAESGFEDLQPLKEMIGNARIVGLGENTHGTSEVFKMKHRLVEFLASEMGFTIFSIEANLPEAYKLNDYVLYGKGDSKALLKGMYFWTWNTQEVLDMIEWMRKFNASGKGKIQFTGFDMQFYMGALENLSSFSKQNDRILKSKLDSLSVLFEKLRLKELQSFKSGEVNIMKQKCENIFSYVSKQQKRITRELSDLEFTWLKQNAAILVQFTELLETSGRNRDECMAKNIDWILDNNPKSKIVLWAHNYHISKDKITMGGFLNKKYADQYFNIGFFSNSGTYTAWNINRLSSDNVLPASEPGSIEYSFHKTGIKSFLFDFARANMNKPESKWLLDSLTSQNPGAVALNNPEFIISKISKSYNAVIFIDSTHASHCFDVH
jgi:erythromycin esterase